MLLSALGFFDSFGLALGTPQMRTPHRIAALLTGETFRLHALAFFSPNRIASSRSFSVPTKPQQPPTKVAID